MRFIKLLINIYMSKSLMAYHQLLFAPIPPFALNAEMQYIICCESGVYARYPGTIVPGYLY